MDSSPTILLFNKAGHRRSGEGPIEPRKIDIMGANPALNSPEVQSTQSFLLYKSPAPTKLTTKRPHQRQTQRIHPVNPAAKKVTHSDPCFMKWLLWTPSKFLRNDERPQNGSFSKKLGDGNHPPNSLPPIW